jgi:hypothetical protein
LQLNLFSQLQIVSLSISVTRILDQCTSPQTESPSTHATISLDTSGFTKEIAGHVGFQLAQARRHFLAGAITLQHWGKQHPFTKSHAKNGPAIPPHLAASVKY